MQDYDDLSSYIEVKESPQKSQETKPTLYKGNDNCRIVEMDCLDNAYVAPLLMNARQDTPSLISTVVAVGVQENASFLIDLDAVPNRKDVLCDGNGAWKMTGCRVKYFQVQKEGGRVITLEKMGTEEEAHTVIRRRSYVCKSCPTFHRTVVSIEYGKEIEKWFPVVLVSYRFDGSPKSFRPEQHGNRKALSSMAYVCTKESTKKQLVSNLCNGKAGPKRALFKTVRDVGGISEAASTSDLPQNSRQAYYEKTKSTNDVSDRAKGSKDALASVLDLQKGECRGFIREVICNDLPTIVMFTDKQVNDIIKFCCHQQPGFVCELGADITFQLGPFYLLVTTYKHTQLQVKGSNRSPSFLGPVMICMTKEEQTYLSFIHCLLHEVPGLGQYLHAYGSDHEAALVNALAAGFPNAKGLLCFIHLKKNIACKLQKLGLSAQARVEICRDIFGKPRGLMWEESTQFLERATNLMAKWDEIETKERRGSPQFSIYFKKQYLDDIRNKTAKFVMQDLGLGTDPYTQNVPESVNKMIKDWVNFLPSEIDSFIISIHDLVQSFEEEEQMMWFGLSDKWEVRKAIQNHLPKKSHMEMTPDERKSTLVKLSKIYPDPAAFYRCKHFRFKGVRPLTAGPSTGYPGSTQEPSLPSLRDLNPLKGSFTEEELLSLAAKSGALIHRDAIRRGFQQGSFLVDSKRPPPNSVPYTVTALTSGTCSCQCAYYLRNDVCCHVIAVAWKSGILSQALDSYKGRSTYSISSSTAAPSVGRKGAGKEQEAENERLPKNPALGYKVYLAKRALRQTHSARKHLIQPPS